MGAEIGGKIDDYDVKSQLPDFKNMEQLGSVAPKKPMDIDDYEG
jgi:hypothetical protein